MKKLLVLFIAISSLLATPAYALKIFEIDVFGNQRISKGPILARFDVKKGQDVDRFQLSRALKSLYASGLYSDLKLFIVADPEVRAQRRFLELSEKGVATTLQPVKKNLMERDKMDTSRAASPLRKADDAIEIDTTYMTRSEQLAKVLALVQERIKA